MIQTPIPIPADLSAKGQTVCGGRQGEDGFRELVISIADELKSSDIDYYVLNFIMGGNAKTSDRLTLESDGCLHYPLPISITDNDIVTVDISAFDMNGSEVVRQGRSPLLTLTFEPSNNVDGAAVIDEKEKGTVAKAVETLEKFSESPSGGLLYNGNPIGGSIETVSDVSELPLIANDGDLVYLEKTGKITTDFTKVPLQWALDTDDEITNKIYPKLYFNPRPDTSGMPAIEDFYFDVYADNPSITKESLEDDESLTEGRGIEIQVAPITDLDESYSGTDAVILVLSTDLITYKQTDYLYVPNDMFLPLEEDVAVYAKSGWNVLKTRLKGFSSGKPVYEYITVPRDEPPALSYGVIYHKSEYGDGFAEKITALAEILQPNPYYINLPAGVVGYFDGLWHGQDYLSGDSLSDDIRNLQADIAEIKGLIEGG
jgi:hypothetical protein